MPVIATLLGPSQRSYQTIRFTSLASSAFDVQYLVRDGTVNTNTNEPFCKATKSCSYWLASQSKKVVRTMDYDFANSLKSPHKQ